MYYDRKISTSFWNDVKIEKLAFTEKYLFLYLLFNNQTSLSGCYEFSIDKICFEANLTKNVTIKSLDVLVDMGLIIIDNDSNEVMIVNWIKYNWTKKASANRVFYESILNVKSLKLKEILLIKFFQREGSSEFISPSTNSSDISKFSSSTKSNTVTYNYTQPNSISNAISSTDSITDSDSIDRDSYEGLNEHTIVDVILFKVNSILNYLKSKSNIDFDLNDPIIINLVIDRLKSYKYEDFICVIDSCVNLLSGDSNSYQFLYPSNIFEINNFRKYISSQLR